MYRSCPQSCERNLQREKRRLCHIGPTQSRLPSRPEARRAPTIRPRAKRVIERSTALRKTIVLQRLAVIAQTAGLTEDTNTGGDSGPASALSQDASWTLSSSATARRFSTSSARLSPRTAARHARWVRRTPSRVARPSSATAIPDQSPSTGPKADNQSSSAVPVWPRSPATSTSLAPLAFTPLRPPRRFQNDVGIAATHAERARPPRRAAHRTAVGYASAATTSEGRPRQRPAWVWRSAVKAGPPRAAGSGPF